MVIETAEVGALQGVVAIGASAGGVEALSNVAAGLAPDVPYAYLMVLHVPAGAPSILARIIDRSGPLPAVAAQNGAPLEPGHIYVGVPDRHLMVADHQSLLSQGPTENGHRPAINALFRSVALTYGPRAIGVLLSGVLDDGVLGMGAIRSRGGATISQSPEDALFPAMPTNAVEAGVVNRQAPAADIGAVLKELSHREIEDSEMERDSGMELENRIAMMSRFATDFDTQKLGAPSGYICPDCNGSLVSISEGNFPLPSGSCVDGRGPARRAGHRARGGDVDRGPQPAGKGQAGPGHGGQSRNREARPALRRNRGRGRTRADAAQRPTVDHCPAGG